MTTPSHDVTRFSSMFVIAGIALVLAGIGITHTIPDGHESADMTTMAEFVPFTPREQPTAGQQARGPVASPFLWGEEFFIDSEEKISAQILRCEDHLLENDGATAPGAGADAGQFGTVLWEHEGDLARHVNLVKYVHTSEPERIINSELGMFVARVETSVDLWGDLFRCYLDTRIPQTLRADSQTIDEKIVAVYQFEGVPVPGSCVLFCDHAGYEPGWVEDYKPKSARAGMSNGYGQGSFDGNLIALWNQCSDAIREDPRGRGDDGRWCMEFNDLGLDDMRHHHGSMEPSKCEVFCDGRAYEPDWVTEGMDPNGILSMCQKITSEPAGDKTMGLADLSWCGQFIGHVVDGLNSIEFTDNVAAMDVASVQPDAGCSLFCDHTGYEPDWVTGNMGKFRAWGICMDTVYGDRYGSSDLDWCVEFQYNLFDNLIESQPDTACNLFCDYTGYEPDWVTEGMRENEASITCVNAGDITVHENNRLYA